MTDQRTDTPEKPANESVPVESPDASDPFAPRARGRIARRIIILVIVLAAFAGGFFVRDRLRGHAAPDAVSAQGGKKQLWTCSMHPQVIKEEPGLCPICHMKLEPLDVVQTGGSTMPGGGASTAPAGGGSVVRIDPVVVQNMGIRVAEVTRGPVRQEVRAVGYLDEAQPLVHDINLRVSGWIEKLHAATEGQHLEQGDPLFDLYSPEIQVAVQELIAARKATESLGPSADELSRKTNQTLVQASHQKLELWGISPREVDRLAQQERPPPTVTFTSPITGHVTQKLVVQGAAVKAGDRVLRIVDHSTLWLDAQVHAQDLPFLNVGQKVVAAVESAPGKTFEGEIIFIHPHVDPVTRTATVRTAVANPKMNLRPGMFATVRITAALAEEALLVPREAVIDTGTRQIVFVPSGEGRFQPRNVELGASSSDGNVQVLAGLAAGEKVVTSGQFLLDAESRMREAIQKHLDSKLLAGGARGDTAPVAATPAPPASRATTPAISVSREAPAPTTATATATTSSPVTVTAEADDVYKAYLRTQNVLGASQLADAKPVDVAQLVAAAQGVVRVTSGAQQRLPQGVLDAATAMQGKPLEEQRKHYKMLSDSVIAMAETLPPTKAVADKLFVMYCPMEKARWLQTGEMLANPYYATEMKQCGENQRTIAAAVVGKLQRP